MKYLVCNLKSNFVFKEIREYKNKLEKIISKNNLVICPSFCYLPIMHSSKYVLGAQDVSKYEDTSHTGYVNAKSLKSIDVNYVLINHSETKDTKEDVKEKINVAIKNKLNVLLFVSETKEEYDYQYTIEKILEQLKYYINDIKKENLKYINIVYEPAWLVGKNESLDVNFVENMLYVLKKECKEIYGYEFLMFYGGGLTLNKAKEYLKTTSIDGLVLGSLALNPDNIMKLYQI